MGVVRERLSPLYMEDSDNGLHFANVRELAAVSPGLTVVEPCDERLISNASFVVTASTVVELFAPQASFVICVSMRSSSATIDPYTGDVLLERSAGCVAAVIRALSAPYRFPWAHVPGKQWCCCSAWEPCAHRHFPSQVLRRCKQRCI